MGLALTVTRFRERLTQRIASLQDFEATAAQLHALLVAASPKQQRLNVLQASRQTASGNSIHMIPIEDVVFFEAADQYIRVLTASEEFLIRTPLKDLLAQLDQQRVSLPIWCCSTPPQ